MLTGPDPSKVREFPNDVRDGKFVLPIGRRMPLRDAAEAHLLGRKAALGRSSCWRQIYEADFFTATSVDVPTRDLEVFLPIVSKPLNLALDQPATSRTPPLGRAQIHRTRLFSCRSLPIGWF